MPIHKMIQKDLNAALWAATRRVIVRLALAIIPVSFVIGCAPSPANTPIPIPTTAIPSTPIAPTLSSSAQPESNFGFVLEYGACYTNVLDTFKGEFTQDRVVEPSITILLQLTSQQMLNIFQKMDEIHLAEYPELFAIPTQDDEPVGIVTPSVRYLLQVRNGATQSTVRWNDEIVQPTSWEADQLRELLQMIIHMIRESPSFRQLPELKFGCA